MSDTARQAAQQPELPADEREQHLQEQRPQEWQPALPTPAQFYKRLVAREDVRTILKRLADN